MRELTKGERKLIHRLTLLKDLPESEAGFTFYLRGGQASHDGEEWFAWMSREPIYNRMYHLFRDGREDWILVEEADIADNSYDLQETFPDRQLVSFKEALDELGFNYDESFYGINNIRCCQNEQVKMLGATKADCLYCGTCGNALQDAVNFLVWGLEDIKPPTNIYFSQFRYDPYKKYLTGKVKAENRSK